jgi:hypothetical protein
MEKVESLSDRIRPEWEIDRVNRGEITLDECIARYRESIRRTSEPRRYTGRFPRLHTLGRRVVRIADSISG